MARQAGADQDLLTMALVGYEAQKAKINAAISEIHTQLGHRGPGRPKAAAAGGEAPTKRTLSAAARKRIAAAQRKRWAAVRAQGKSAAAPKKRKLSAAARKSIGDAARKRWAAVRKAAAKKAQPVVKAAAAGA